MPARLRPTAPIAADAILVGDPGRALLLAQELLDGPKMSNHARGLWGYTGPTHAGCRLTIQSTGMGGPSAAVVLTDLAKLGVRRAVRIGTCAAFDGESRPGDLLVVDAALAEGASGTPFGVMVGETALPNPKLTECLRHELPEARAATIASFDTIPAIEPAAGRAAADMQTATVFACGKELDLAVAGVLIVDIAADGARLSDDGLEAAAKGAGRAAASSLSS